MSCFSCANACVFHENHGRILSRKNKLYIGFEILYTHSLTLKAPITTSCSNVFEASMTTSEDPYLGSALFLYLCELISRYFCGILRV